MEDPRPAEEFISDKELPTVLQSLELEALTLMREHNFWSALACLKKVEEIIESVTTQGGHIDPDRVACTIANITVCYDSLEDLPNSLKYLDACLYNSQIPRPKRFGFNKAEAAIRRHKFICKAALMYASALEKLGSRAEAFKKAEVAVLNATSALAITCEMAKRMHANTLRKRKGGQRLQLLSRVFPTIKSIQQFLLNGKLTAPPEMRSALGVRGHPDWVYDFTLTQMTKLNPCSIEDFIGGVGIQAEFSKDYLLYKIALLAVSLFALSKTCKLTFRKKSAEYARKALKLLRTFFPVDSQLFLDIGEPSEELANYVRQRTGSLHVTKEKIPRRPTSALGAARKPSTKRMTKNPSQSTYSFEARKKPRTQENRGRLIVD